MHGRSHNTTYGIVNQEDTIEVIISSVVIHNTNPHQLTFHIMGGRLKGEKTERIKTSYPCRGNLILHAINLCQHISLFRSTRIKLYFLPFDEPKLCNDHILMDPKYNDRLYFLNQIDLNTNLLDNVLLKKVSV